MGTVYDELEHQLQEWSRKYARHPKREMMEIRILRKFGWNRWILRRLPRVVFRRAEKTFMPHGVRLPPELRADLWRSFRQKQVRAYVPRMCAGYQGTLLVWSSCMVRSPARRWCCGESRISVFRRPTPSGCIIRGSHLQVIPGARHWMAWYLAGEVAGRIRDFLSAV